MKINQKVRYGVACLYELSKNPTEHMDADQIASKQNIPPAFAQKVLQSLSHVGLVIGVKGVGYKLQRPLAEITALEVIEALSNENENTSPLTDLGNLLEQRLRKVLETVNLGSLVL